MLQDRLELSERRACRVTGQHRSTQRRWSAPSVYATVALASFVTGENVTRGTVYPTAAM